MAAPRSDIARALAEAIERKIRERKGTEQSDTDNRYYNDPVSFARDAFGLMLWAKQAEIALALVRGKRVAAKSGHKVGKSTLAAVLAFWWCYTRKRARVIMTSASGRQVRSILWREIKRLYRERKPGFNFPAPAELPDIGIRWEDGREIVGFSTDDPERMAGISGDQILFILDEASGIKEAIFDAVEGNTAGGGSILMLSNPTQVSGTFFDAFNRSKAEWATFTISSEETPNCVEGREVVRGLATREWVEKRRRGWGVDSPRYAVRVKGDFPLEGDDTVIPLGLVEAARQRWEDMERDGGWLPEELSGAMDAGIDVARFGDDETVFAFRRGRRLILKAEDGLDTQEVAGVFIRECRKRAPGARVRVFIDGIGVGAGVVDALRTFVSSGNDWLDVYEVINSESASDSTEYVNRRAENAFAMRRWLEAGGALADDVDLEGELVATKFKFDGKGRIQIESKDEIRKRLGRSPDRADGATLAICGTTSNYAGGSHKPRAVSDSRWSGMGRGF